jgi:serine/threonine protein kinase
MPCAKARRLLAQLLGLLQCVHEKGLVHRDLKPDNLMQGSAREVLHLIVGVAIRSEHQHGSSMVTPDNAAEGVCVTCVQSISFSSQCGLCFDMQDFGAATSMVSSCTIECTAQGSKPDGLLHVLILAPLLLPNTGPGL